VGAKIARIFGNVVQVRWACAFQPERLRSCQQHAANRTASNPYTLVARHGGHTADLVVRKTGKVAP